MSNSNQVKIVDQKCIGYQRDGDKINGVFQNTVKLENGSVKIDWHIQYSNGSRSLPLAVQPHTDIAP